MVPPKRKQKHIIGDDENELEEEQDVKPLIPVLYSKGKEKILKEDDSEKDPEDIDAELEVAATRVTQIVIKKKILLDIIAEITTEDSTTVKPTSAAPHKMPTKSPPTVPKGSSKCKEATSGGATILEEPKHKRARTIQPKASVPVGTPLISPSLSQKKKQPTIPPQGLPKDRLSSSTKK